MQSSSYMIVDVTYADEQSIRFHCNTKYRSVIVVSTSALLVCNSIPVEQETGDQ